MGGTHLRPGSDDSEDNKKQSSKTSDSSGTAKPKKKLTDLSDEKYGLGEFLTVQEQQKLRGVNRFFNQTIGEDRPINARLACRHVLTGQPEDLLKLLAKDPDIFFQKYPEVTFKAAGQVFYKVSPADLIYFLCDDDMWKKVKAFAENLPEEQQTPFFEKWQAQQKAMGKGGADLLYVTGNTPPQYASCFAMQENFNAFGENMSITIGLKNPDGIVCWKGPDNQVHLYYANPETEALEPIKVRSGLSDEQQAAYDTFKLRINNTMMTMRPEGAARAERSSDEVHQLFQAIFLNSTTHQPIKLTRQGLHYKEDGIDYMDTHYDANRVDNPYLKCIHLYQAANVEQNSDRRNALYHEGDRVWKTECANALKKRIWMLQRYCEKNRPFYPLPNFNEPPFQRSLMIYNWITVQDELLFDVKSEQFLDFFGLDYYSGFSIYKGAGGGAGVVRRATLGAVVGWVALDLIPENRLTVDATTVVERPIDLPAPSAGLSPGR